MFLTCASYPSNSLIPLVLSLNITLESAPEPFQNARISLRWAPNDPVEFVLGAFTNDASVMVATTLEVMENFIADSTVDMGFNYTSPSENDCTLYAWVPVPWAAGPSDGFAQSEPFTITSRRYTTTATPSTPTLSRSKAASTSPTTSNPAASSSTSSVSETASDVPFRPASHAGVIVGGVLGVLALGCLSVYVLIRRRRSNAATPLLCPQDSATFNTTLPRSSVNSRSISLHEERETEAAPGVSTRVPLEGENSRMREELTALESQIGSMEEPLSEVPIRPAREVARLREEIAALEDRIRRMEAVYRNSPPPPSYRSSQYLLFQ
ncbi:hypothetical protein EDD18DRAFT_1345520 [Armillaria luteobubalina]|uniref:Uncharacterized protein n=1 Tax=Armillaria luteobubalina TaxID=153913 RepID=A0AA39QJA1_9AGAR|nr:hypothetical protein EDD18DRAFT_1345520 [Armillaria luteobubalina]